MERVTGEGLTAAEPRPPVAHGAAAQQATGSGVGLRELTVQLVHRRILAQGEDAGVHVGLWVHEAVTGVEGRRPQGLTADPQRDSVFVLVPHVSSHVTLLTAESPRGSRWTRQQHRGTEPHSWRETHNITSEGTNTVSTCLERFGSSNSFVPVSRFGLKSLKLNELLSLFYFTLRGSLLPPTSRQKLNTLIEAKLKLHGFNHLTLCPLGERIQETTALHSEPRWSLSTNQSDGIQEALVQTQCGSDQVQVLLTPPPPCFCTCRLDLGRVAVEEHGGCVVGQ